MPTSGEWWFPTLSLRVSDDWSNAPDLLQPGEGVLRVVRLEALGVTPEMIPPMPELTSPSAIIFPHPEKRLVELTPEGPVTYAFWRWTIRPSNDTSTIVEPLRFSYFDTINRNLRDVTISAQRVAYGAVTGPAASVAVSGVGAATRLPGWPVAVIAGVVLVAGTIAGVGGRTIIGVRAVYRFAFLDPLARRMRRAARAGDMAGVRRLSTDMIRRDGLSKPRMALLDMLDQALFDPRHPTFNLEVYAKRFLAR